MHSLLSRSSMVLGMLVAALALTFGVALAQPVAQMSFGDGLGQFRWLTPWLIVALIGGAAGITEIVAKYKDEPGRALTTVPAALYVGVNALASVAAYALIVRLNWSFSIDTTGTTPRDDFVQLSQVLVAGFGAPVILRSAVFTVRAPGREEVVGPANVMRTILDACDRAVDRKRAEARAAEVSRLMKNLSFDRASIELPVVALALMQNMSEEAKTRLRDDVDDLRKTSMSNEGMCLSLGLILLGALGVDALRAAIETVKNRIRVSEDDQLPAIDFMHPIRISVEAQEKEEPVLLTLIGRNFLDSSRVLLNGEVQKTTFDAAANQLQASLPIAMLKERGEHDVTVFTPIAEGGESTPRSLFLAGANPTPDLYAIEPATITEGTVLAGGEFELIVSGRDFVAASVVRVDGADQTTVFVSDRELTASVAATALSAPGDDQVTVFNPEPFGGESPPRVLTVIVPGAPQIVGPAPMGANGAQDATPPTADDVTLIMGEPVATPDESVATGAPNQ